MAMCQCENSNNTNNENGVAQRFEEDCRSACFTPKLALPVYVSSDANLTRSVSVFCRHNRTEPAMSMPTMGTMELYLLYNSNKSIGCFFVATSGRSQSGDIDNEHHQAIPGIQFL